MTRRFSVALDGIPNPKCCSGVHGSSSLLLAKGNYRRELAHQHSPLLLYFTFFNFYEAHRGRTWPLTREMPEDGCLTEILCNRRKEEKEG